jgi:hypothetical protein
MSLIGPRPLLPRDQPKNIEIRLIVRPGITGWARANGGTLMIPDEKEVLDEWSSRNASLRLDVQIIFMTAVMFCRGDRSLPSRSTRPMSSRSTSRSPAERGVQRATALARGVDRSKENASPSALRSQPFQRDQRATDAHISLQ